jgi:hypothetical protein
MRKNKHAFPYRILLFITATDFNGNDAANMFDIQLAVNEIDKQQQNPTMGFTS